MALGLVVSHPRGGHGGKSFRSIETFIKVHRRRLNTAFGLRWQRAPAHTAIRYILQGLEHRAVERGSSRHAAGLRDAATDPARRSIALDGRRFRGGFTNLTTRRAAKWRTAFTVEAGRVKVDIKERSTETPAPRRFPGDPRVGPGMLPHATQRYQKKPTRLQGERRVGWSIKRRTIQPSFILTDPPACPAGRPAATPPPSPGSAGSTQRARRCLARLARRGGPRGELRARPPFSRPAACRTSRSREGDGAPPPRDRIMRGKFSRVGRPRRRRRPVSRAYRAHDPLRQRRRLSGRSLSQAARAGRVRQVRLHHIPPHASHTELEIKCGSFC